MKSYLSMMHNKEREKKSQKWRKIGENIVNRKKNSGKKNQYLGRNINARKDIIKNLHS